MQWLQKFKILMLERSRMKVLQKLEVFTDEAHVVHYGDVAQFDLGLEPYELSTIFEFLELSNSGWFEDDFKIHGAKCYDEEGNSYIVGSISIEMKGRGTRELLELEKRWLEAEKKSLS